VIAEPLLAAAAIAAGACVGSFVTTAALRAANGENALSGRSRCDACGVELGYAATVPVISFVRLRGACAACGARIDGLHLAGEVSGSVVVLAAIVIGPADPRGWLVALLGFILLGAAVFDARTQRLPDALTAVAAVLCAVLAWTRSLEALETGAIAALIAFVVIEAIRHGYRALRDREGLGFGDVKLIAALALWLGAAIPWAVAVASLAGLGTALALRRAPEARLPFGPFLAFGGFSAGLCAEVLRWPMS
jgi:leader peptidase (prepilin peptidase)/N-methyltransferase